MCLYRYSAKQTTVRMHDGGDGSTDDDRDRTGVEHFRAVRTDTDAPEATRKRSHASMPCPCSRAHRCRKWPIKKEFNATMNE